MVLASKETWEEMVLEHLGGLGATLQHQWGCCTRGKGDVDGAAGTRSSKVECFLLSPQNGGTLGLIFPADSLIFLAAFPAPTFEARSAPPVACLGFAHEGSAAQQ